MNKNVTNKKTNKKHWYLMDSSEAPFIQYYVAVFLVMIVSVINVRFVCCNLTRRLTGVVLLLSFSSCLRFEVISCGPVCRLVQTGRVLLVHTGVGWVGYHTTT